MFIQSHRFLLSVSPPNLVIKETLDVKAGHMLSTAGINCQWRLSNRLKLHRGQKEQGAVLQENIRLTNTKSNVFRKTLSRHCNTLMRLNPALRGG